MITNSMEKSISKDNNYEVSQKICSILWNPKECCCEAQW